MPGLRSAFAVPRRCSSQPAISLAIIFVRMLGDVGNAALVRNAVEIDDVCENRYGWASASWIIMPPPFECPMTGTGRFGLI